MPSETEKERYRAMNEALLAAGRTNRIRGRMDGVAVDEMNQKITEIRRRNRFGGTLPAAQPTESAERISMSDALRAMRQNDEAGEP